MAMQLPDDFKEFLRLLDSKGVEYLLVGGYAVAFHGYPRATGDLDIWIATSAENARRLVDVVREFGFDTPDLCDDLFLAPDSIIRMGEPPMRIAIFPTISGVRFADCLGESVSEEIDGVPARIIGLAQLKANKRASGRHRDLDDLEHLP